MTGIAFESVSYAYPGRKNNALSGVDLVVPESSIFALLGPNGAGKTTLLRVLCGRLAGYTGQLHIPMPWLNSQGILDARSYGVLIENPGVYGRLTVLEYLEFFGKFYAILDLKQRIKTLAERVKLSELHRKMSALSLGTRQKVQIVRALLHKPPLVLLDEPASNLDPIARDEVWNLVREYNQQYGCTFIICSHVLTDLEQHCTHLGFLRNSELIANGTLDAIRAQYPMQSKVTIRLGSLGNTGLTSHELEYDCADPAKENPRRIQQLVEQGADVIEVNVARQGLSDLYRRLVQGDFV